MSTNIVVPELGESVVSATVLRWLKQEGERVSAGESVVELETEKVNLEIGAEQTGVLTQDRQARGRGRPSGRRPGGDREGAGERPIRRTRAAKGGGSDPA